MQRDGELAVVTFDSPPLNLFDAELAHGLEEALLELERSHPRAVLFRAEGRVVSGGVDVELFAALSGAESAARTFDGLVDHRPPRGRAAVSDHLRRPRALPDLGVRAGPGL